MSKSILIIDDQPEIVDVIEGLVSEAFDVSIDTAYNGVEAQENLQNKKYEVICTDHFMPEMKGTELVAHLRTGNGANKETPIVIITANENGLAFDVENFSDVGIFNKVEEITRIVEILSRYLGPPKDGWGEEELEDDEEDTE